MNRPLLFGLCVTASLTWAQQPKRAAPERPLAEKNSIALDARLAGDVSRKQTTATAAPRPASALIERVELQLHQKRLEQIETLKALLDD